MYIDASQLDQVVSLGVLGVWAARNLMWLCCTCARSLGLCDACTGGRRCVAYNPRSTIGNASTDCSLLWPLQASPATSSITESQSTWLAGAAGAGRVCDSAEVPAAAAGAAAAAAVGAPRRQALPWPHAAGPHALIPQAVLKPLAGERLFVIPSGLRDMS